MKKPWLLKFLVPLFVLSLANCNLLTSLTGEESESNTDVMTLGALALLSTPASKTAVLGNYANLAYFTYADTVLLLTEFKAQVDTFVAKASPTAADLIALQTKYKEIRRTFLLTEAFRFSDGPIDNTSVFSIDGEEAEGLLNAWPLDEANLDSDFITGSQAITTANLLTRNGSGGTDENVTIGWHAVEYILWGYDGAGANTDTYNQTAGIRSNTEFTTAGTGSANAKRSLFLQTATQRLINDLTLLRDQWSPENAGNYRNATFLAAANTDSSVRSIIKGLASFSQSEWGGERLKGLTSGSQNQDEHSCFSDLTKDDFYYDAQGVLNVFTGFYAGRTGSTFGPGVGNLISSLNSLQATIFNSIVAGRDAFVDTTTWRYDSVISPSRSSEEAAVLASLSSSRETIVGLGALFVQLGSQIGLSVTPE